MYLHPVLLSTLFGLLFIAVVVGLGCITIKRQVKTHSYRIYTQKED